MEIKLIDHVGYAHDGRAIDCNQWIVFADNVQIGYLPKSPGAVLQCIVSFDDATRAELIEAVNKKVAADIGGVVMPVDPDDEPNEDDDE